MPASPRRAPLGVARVVCVACLTSVAAGALRAQAPRVVNVTAVEYALRAPDTLDAGPTTFHLVNHGTLSHHLMVFTYPAGMSWTTFDQWMRKDSVEAGGIEVVGGTEGNDEGAREAWTTVDLAPGRYILACVLPLPDGSGTHRMKGMHRVLTVRPRRARGTPTPMPRPDATVRMADFAYTGMPDTLRAGWHVLRFENAGTHEHLALIQRFRPGKTLADLQAWGADQRGEPPTVQVGGAATLSPGRADEIRVHLAPGHYVMLCVLTNGTEPKLHAQMGMFREFVVR
ncbi:MAG TPA: hypothetical protein VF041_17830 [Gemmatimonadaceae bacterium]